MHSVNSTFSIQIKERGGLKGFNPQLWPMGGEGWFVSK